MDVSRVGIAIEIIYFVAVNSSKEMNNELNRKCENIVVTQRNQRT